MFEVQAEGADALRVSLEGASRQAARRAGQVVRKTATDIQADARRFAPVDTGALRGSISSDVRHARGGIEAEIGPTVHYGRWVEQGTSRMAPRAFMGPALDRNSPGYVSALSQAMTEGL